MSEVTLLGRFVFNDDEIHRDGGQGLIFLGYDSDSDKQVAIKKFHLHDALAKNSFRKEVEALTRLKHPSIVKIIDSTVIDSAGYLIIPWMRQNLLEYLDEQSEWSNTWALDRVLIPLVDALSYMHERGQSHRDISGRNVMIEMRKPIFIDFASSAEANNRAEDKTTGPSYTRGYTPDDFGTVFEKDIYSFGVLALEVYLRRRLQTRQQIESALEDITSAPAKAIITKCVSLEPSKRYPDAMQLKPELDSIKNQILATQQERHFLVEIVLTNSAREGLKNWSKGKFTLEMSLTAHLKTSLTFWYPATDENGQDSRTKFWLVADGVRFLIAPSSDQVGWTAVTAISADSADLEKYRRNGKEITHLKIPWNVVNYFTPTSISRAGFEFIANRYQEWIETGKPNNDADLERRDARDYMSKLLRTMEAKEDIAKGRKEPIYFEKSKNLGTRVTMELSELPEYPLEGTYWRLAGKGPAVGEVDYQSGSAINFLLRRSYVGKFPENGKLLPEVAAGSQSAYKRQRDAIESIISGTARGSKIGDYLANPQEVPRNHANHPDRWFIQDLDEPKREAISHVLGSSSITLVQGPPGTGKTTFISELIAQTLSKDPNTRILLVSQTHVALDNALERLSKLDIEGVVRLGNPDSERISNSSKELLLDKKMQDWVTSLEMKSTAFAQKFAQQSGFTLDEARKVILLTRARQELHELNLVRESESKELLEKDSTGTLSQIIEMPTDTEIEKRESYAQTSLEKKLGEISNPSLISKYESNELVKEDFDVIIKEMLGDRKIDNRFNSIISAQSDWLNRVGSSDQLSQLFLKSCKVLAGTCIGFLGHPAVRTLDFDLCILDEASRATITESLVPMSRSSKWVIVGDGKQLGAFDGEMSDTASYLDEYDLEKADLIETFFSRFELNLARENKRFLSIQYRMNNQIGQLISDCFYEGKLDSKGPTKHALLEIMELEPVTWFDTSTFPPSLREESRSHGSSSIVNNAESRVINSEIKRMVKVVEEQPHLFHSKPHILVITPYTHQVDLLRISLSEFSNNDSIILDIQTIDSVQGREADFVFYSPVRSNIRGNVGFLNEENFQRTNVALSRGRHMTAIVGDCSFWEDLNSPLSSVLRIVKQGTGKVKMSQNA